MRYVRYYYDHKKGSECFGNTLIKSACTFPISLESVADWIEGEKYFTQRERKENYYLLYTVEGSGIVEYRNKRVVLGPGQLCFIYCTEPHYYATYNCKIWHNIWFHIDGPGSKCYFDLINGEKEFNIITLKDTNFMKKTYDRLVPHIMMKDIVSESHINAILTEFLDIVVTQLMQEKHVIAETPPFWVKLVPDYIDSRRNEDITISQLSEEFKVPPYEMETMFLRCWDIDLTEYIRESREDYVKQNNANIKCQNPQWAFDAISYIENNCHTKINLADLAQSYHVSQPVFFRNFKRYTCASPSEYLLRRRLYKALSALESTDDPIADVAYSCGFPSSSFFSEKFKEWTGVTPKKYRTGTK